MSPGATRWASDHLRRLQRLAHAPVPQIAEVLRVTEGDAGMVRGAALFELKHGAGRHLAAAVYDPVAVAAARAAAGVPLGAA